MSLYEKTSHKETAIARAYIPLGVVVPLGVEIPRNTNIILVVTICK